MDWSQEIEALQLRIAALENKVFKKKQPKGESDVAKIRDAFLSSFEMNLGRKYPGFGARENGQAKNWLKSCPISTALRLCEIYPKWKNVTAARRGHAFSDLIMRWVELSAWVDDADKTAFLIAEATVADKLSIRKAEEIIYVERIAAGTSKQTTGLVGNGYKLRPEISDETEC